MMCSCLCLQDLEGDNSLRIVGSALNDSSAQPRAGSPRGLRQSLRAHSNAPPQRSRTPPPSDAAIAQLIALGFEHDASMDALRRSHNMVEVAANLLLASSAATGATTGATSGAASGGAGRVKHGSDHYEVGMSAVSPSGGGQLIPAAFRTAVIVAGSKQQQQAQARSGGNSGAANAGSRSRRGGAARSWLDADEDDSTSSDDSGSVGGRGDTASDSGTAGTAGSTGTGAGSRARHIFDGLKNRFMSATSPSRRSQNGSRPSSTPRMSPTAAVAASAGHTGTAAAARSERKTAQSNDDDDDDDDEEEDDIDIPDSWSISSEEIVERRERSPWLIGRAGSGGAVGTPPLTLPSLPATASASASASAPVPASAATGSTSTPALDDDDDALLQLAMAESMRTDVNARAGSGSAGAGSSIGGSGGAASLQFQSRYEGFGSAQLFGNINASMYGGGASESKVDPSETTARAQTRSGEDVGDGGGEDDDEAECWPAPFAFEALPPRMRLRMLSELWNVSSVATKRAILVAWSDLVESDATGNGAAAASGRGGGGNSSSGGNSSASSSSAAASVPAEDTSGWSLSMWIAAYVSLASDATTAAAASSSAAAAASSATSSAASTALSPQLAVLQQGWLASSHSERASILLDMRRAAVDLVE
jgi:hypothetical protein